MASLKLYLDTRSVNANGESPLKIAISHKGKTSLLNLSIKIRREAFDAENGILIGKENKRLNSIIQGRMTDARRALMSIMEDGSEQSLSANGLRDKIYNYIFDIKAKEEKHSLFEFIEAFASSKKPSNCERYITFLHIFQKYQATDIFIEDIDKAFIDGFRQFIDQSNLKQNSKSEYFKRFMAVLNSAIDKDIPICKIPRNLAFKREETKKRALPVEVIRELKDSDLIPELARDLFMLSFYLIGINTVDLNELGPIVDGYLSYYRHKTGKLYTIKVEPEALEIIQKYRNVNDLNLLIDTRHKSAVMLTKYLNRSLSKFRSDITMYYARHSWATIAAELDIPFDVISEALGHSHGATVTNVYIKFNHKKVEDANRRVIDYLLYNKR